MVRTMGPCCWASVLHASLPYFSRIGGIESFWPANGQTDQSILGYGMRHFIVMLAADFIHTWRMPAFFLLAGFFAHLVAGPPLHAGLRPGQT